MANDELQGIRRTVNTYRGLRKIRAEAELVEKLASVDVDEALAIAGDSAGRARSLLAKATRRNADRRPYQLNLAWILRAWAYAQKNARNYAEAGVLLSESVALFETVDDGSELIRCYQLRHLLLRDQEKFEAALAALDRALELGKQTGDHSQDAVVFGAQGTLLTLLGRIDESVQAFERGLDIARARDDTFAELVLLVDLGTYHENYGSIEKAIEIYRQVVRIEKQRRVFGISNLATSIWKLASLLSLRENMDAAAEYLEEGIALALDAKLHLLAVHMLVNKARLNTYRANYVNGLECARQALGLCASAGNAAGEAMCLALMGAVHHSVGDAQGAAEHFAKSCAMYAGLNEHEPAFSNEVLSGVTILAEYRCRELDTARYSAFFASVLEADRRGSSADVKLQGIRRGYGLLLHCRGDLDAARREYLLALRQSRQLGLRYNQANIQHFLGKLLGEQGAYDEAVRHVNEALSLAEADGRTDLTRRLHELLASLYAGSNQAQDALAHLLRLRVIEQETLSPQVLRILQERSTRVAYDLLLRDYERSREELAASKDRAATLTRSLQSKDARAAHYSDVLGTVAAFLRQIPGDSEFFQRARQLAGIVSGALGDAGWQEFEAEVRHRDEDFMLRLARDFPGLTLVERKVCSLIRLNNTTKDLCRLLNVSPRTVQSYRYRIRKKLAVPAQTELNAFILAM